MMRKRREILRGACFSLLLVLAWPSFAEAADESVNPRQVAERQAQLEALRARMEQIRDAIRRDEDTRDSLVGELRDVEIRVGEVGEAIRASNRALGAIQVQLHEAVTERDLAAASLSKERQALRSQIRAAYVLGRQERLQLLLRQGEPDSIGRALVYYDYLHAARGRRISSYGVELEALRVLEEEINAHRARIEVLQRAQSEELDAQRTVLKERQNVLANLQRRLQGKQDTLRGLESDEATLRKLVKELQTALRELERGRSESPFSARHGKLEFPVPGKVAVGHGEQPATQVVGAQGLTLVAAVGTEIRAVHGGQVVFADWLKGFGLLLIIDHGDDYLSIYAHNQSLYGRVGDWVGTGDVIATVGNSGGQPRAALYFEIRHRGASLDPLPWFANKAEETTSHDS